jgi:hypothetical protein
MAVVVVADDEVRVWRGASMLFRGEKEHRFTRQLCYFTCFVTRALRRTQRWHVRGLRFRPSPNQAKSQRANAATQQLEDSRSLSKGPGRFKLASAGWNRQTRRFSCDSRCIDSKAPAGTQRRQAADWRQSTQAPLGRADPCVCFRCADAERLDEDALNQRQSSPFSFVQSVSCCERQ